jgi:hypothetical protein
MKIAWWWFAAMCRKESRSLNYVDHLYGDNEHCFADTIVVR